MFWPTGFGLVTHHFVQENDSEEMLTTIGCSSTGFPVGAVATANLFMEAFDDELQSIFSTDIRLDHVTISVGPSSAPTTHVSTASPVFGSDASGIVLPNTSLLVHKRTNQGGRKGRGRMYWPGFGSVTDMAGNGTLNAGAIAGFRDLFENWQEHLEANVGPGAIGNLYLFHTAEETPTQIESLFLDQRLATQRRRLRP